MKRYWIKLELKTLSDPIMGQLPNYLWRRVIELFMLAGGNGDDGLLQPVHDLAWQLHTSESDMNKSLQKLAEFGIVHESPQGWVVSSFKESQASSTSTQRVQEYRKRIGTASRLKRKRNEEGLINESADEIEDEIDDEIEDEIDDEIEDEIEDEIDDEIDDETDDEIEYETEKGTEKETKAVTEAERSLSSSTSASNSLSFSNSSSDSVLPGNEVPEKGAANAFAAFEANIATITPMLADALRADIDEFSEAWVCDAIREAVKSNAPNIKYVEAILKRWQKDGRGNKKRNTESRKRKYGAQKYTTDSEDPDAEAEDRQRYVKGKYADFIEH